MASTINNICVSLEDKLFESSAPYHTAESMVQLFLTIAQCKSMAAAVSILQTLMPGPTYVICLSSALQQSHPDLSILECRVLICMSLTAKKVQNPYYIKLCRKVLWEGFSLYPGIAATCIGSDDDFANEIKRILEITKSVGVSVTELATYTGIKKDNFYAWVSGRRCPPLRKRGRVFCKIAACVAAKTMWEQ